VKKAFLLGAGLGTRLRPLTNLLPKPLIPVGNRPLIAHAFQQLLEVGVEEFIVNTHHLSSRFAEAFPDGRFNGAPVTFVDEQPDVLDTGGGLANVAQLIQDDDCIVLNGDILTDLPLQPAIEAHRKSNNLVTLVLRSGGHLDNVAWDRETGKIRDLRNTFGTNADELFQFASISIVSPEFLPFVRPIPESVVPAWLKVISEHDRLGGVLIDEGDWRDLGDLESYLDAALAHPGEQRIHPSAKIDPSAEVDEFSQIGESCAVGPGARIVKSILWPNVEIAPGANLERCVAGSGVISGSHTNKALA
jgi:mannose-1-phosphate guanylyltransferase